MNLFSYYAALRSEILEIITGVKNSSPNIIWNDTMPNHVTKIRLEQLFEKYLAAAREFGLLVVTRHTDCPNPAHIEFPTSNSYGLHIPYRSPSYIWDGGRFYQGLRLCVCPCSRDSKPTKHYIIEDIVYDRHADPDVCSRLELIISDIFESITSAGNSRPRSAIRERLLRAVIRINDELLPEPMDKYIKSYSTKGQLHNQPNITSKFEQGQPPRALR